MFATATVFNFQQSGQVERNSQEKRRPADRLQRRHVPTARRDERAARGHREAARGPDVAATSSAQPGARTDFRKLSRDVPNIAIGKMVRSRRTRLPMSTRRRPHRAIWTALNLLVWNQRTLRDNWIGLIVLLAIAISPP